MLDNKDQVDMLNGKPYYYIDSSIIIILQRLKEYIAEGQSEAEILAFMTKNGRMTKSGAKDLLTKYELNQAKKLIFCITPTVYKETMLDENIKITRDFVKNNCKLVMPNINFAQYAHLVKTIALEFEEAKSKNGHKGLAPDFNKKTNIDDNVEDRMILSEALAFSMLGKRNIRFLTCGKSKVKVIKNSREVVGLGKRYKQCQVYYGNALPELSSDGDSLNVFIHSNFNDFGDSTRQNNDVRQVSLKVKEIIERFLNSGAKFNVLTPDEVERDGL